MKRDPRQDNEADLPLVTMAIAVLNEVDQIDRCLDTIENQTYPSSHIEIIVADGGSTDGTKERLEHRAELNSTITIIENHQRIQSAGFNCAMQIAHGTYLGRVDAHSFLPPTYIEQCVSLAEQSGAVNVGGPYVAEAAEETPMARAIASATVLPLAIGGAQHRYASQERDVDTLFPGFFLCEALRRIGGFDTSLPVHEDYDVNLRLRTAGGRIRFSPMIRVTYRPRASIKKLAYQYFRYGRGKATVSRSQPRAIRPYHTVPPTLVLALTGSLLAGRRGRPFAIGIAGMYAAFLGMAAVVSGKDEPTTVRIRLPLVIATMHLSWGAGFWVGLLKPLRRPLP